MKISIIIPAYNCEKFISETIESCLKRDRKDIEILLIDDGSADRTFSRCEYYENKYTNVLVLKQENLGESSVLY